MARLEINYNSLDLSLRESEAEEMLREQAVTLEEYWRRYVNAFSRHGLGDKISRSAVKRDKNGDPYTTLSFSGERENGDGTRGAKKLTVRNAEIAFFNEYGTKTVPKRLWMRAANAAAEEDLQKIAEKHNEQLIFER